MPNFNAMPELKGQEAKRPRAEDILAQKAGVWRTVAEAISLGQGTHLDQPTTVDLAVGDEINVIGKFNDGRDGDDKVRIKVVKPALGNEATKWYYIPEANLKGLQVKLNPLK